MCASIFAEPAAECRIIIISGNIASKFFAVSTRLSPFTMLLAEAVIFRVSALSLFAAISKEVRVLVLGSKKRVIMDLPLRVGTFFMGLVDISLKD
jgi:hypothetical protein